MYVLEAHGEVIRSKLSSNQSRYLDIIVTHQKTHYSPRFRVCIFFTSTLSKKHKNLYCLEFLVGPSPFIQLWSLSMFRQLLNTHMRDWAFWRWRSVCRSVLYPTTSSHWAKLKPSNTTQNKRSKCNRIYNWNTRQNIYKHHFSWTNNIKLPTKNESSEAELEFPYDIRIRRVNIGFDY